MKLGITHILVMGLLLAAAMGAAQAAQITQYNQTLSDIDNGAANPWTSLGTSNQVWSTAGGNALLIVNTTVSSGQWGINLTMEAGTGFRSSIGDNLLTLSRNQTYVLGPFELARYKQSNGTLMFSSNASRGKAIFVTLPR
jgi:hypothetical protein